MIIGSPGQLQAQFPLSFSSLLNLTFKGVTITPIPTSESKPLDEALDLSDSRG